MLPAAGYRDYFILQILVAMILPGVNISGLSLFYWLYFPAVFYEVCNKAV